MPLPSARLASTALRALEVDPELSPLVRRQLSVEAAAAAADADQDAALWSIIEQQSRTDQHADTDGGAARSYPVE